MIRDRRGAAARGGLPVRGRACGGGAAAGGRCSATCWSVFVLWLPVLVFVAVGFEHCVANMALFALAILDGTAGFGDLGRSLLFTVPGNIVGGGALVACTYWFTGRPDRGSDSSYE
ncbi:formate/nitrite transporter family protein [Streptomyces sp. NPDC042898]|uniref:formate/nitrite transporter family protein n=1 Tax=Streptomyces sp. NPDC042898 TaxID=3154334 RepID=UPI00340AAC20